MLHGAAQHICCAKEHWYSYQVPDGALLLKGLCGTLDHTKFIFSWLEPSILALPDDVRVCLVRAKLGFPEFIEEFVCSCAVLNLRQRVTPCSKRAPGLQHSPCLFVKGWTIQPDWHSRKDGTTEQIWKGRAAKRINKRTIQRKCGAQHTSAMQLLPSQGQRCCQVSLCSLRSPCGTLFWDAICIALSAPRWRPQPTPARYFIDKKA
jgi:hypothetical protein